MHAKALIWLPETGPRVAAAITTAKINSKRKRTAVCEISMWLFVSCAFNAQSDLTNERYCSLRLFSETDAVAHRDE